MSQKKRGLGRGLGSLLSDVSALGVAAEGDSGLADLPVAQLQPGAHQPRKHFDEAGLAELADSIRARGIVQPLIVRPVSGGRFEIVAGERRFRAAQLVGLKVVPAIVREMDEREAMAVALVENIQRADLNPLEESTALRKLIDECGLTHEQCAQAVGRSRTQVSNLLRLAELDPVVQNAVREGRLSLGHAKVLLGAPPERQAELAHHAIHRELTVRQTEVLLRESARPKPAPRAPARAEPELEQRLSSAFGLPVRIQPGLKGQGKLLISYQDSAELRRLLGLFES
ncbi:ParB/RepB/Spo0J family partition protein [Polycyclovorans algicola]|uniref:ParB/RepB/Spo0J family partition protein n=1 Tax=Polycyclovorans algicola TaxID=616992 RepID=UPI0004A6C802|nr:ParB/RepB/Spo0J family partition protein [Polycyclovorans algicola]